MKKSYYLLMLIFTTALMICGLYLQYAHGLEPCPLCIMQRYAFIMVGIFSLIGLLLPKKIDVHKINLLLLMLSALAGFVVAMRQSWLQWFPPPVADCGPGLEYMLKQFPLQNALPMIFKGAGDCTEVTWTLLGLSIPNWAAICFVVIVALAIMLWRSLKKESLWHINMI